MSKILVDTIDTRSGTSTLTLGSSNAGTIALGSGDVQSNFLYPAFEAYLSADQSISDNTNTKIQFNTERFDTNNNYDNSTNYRFTPQTAGKYFVYSQVEFALNDYDIYVSELTLAKNGSNHTSTFNVIGDGASLVNTVGVTSVVTFNGSSDYVEMFGKIEKHGSSNNRFDAGNTAASYFGAFRIGT